MYEYCNVMRLASTDTTGKKIVVPRILDLQVLRVCESASPQVRLLVRPKLPMSVGIVFLCLFEARTRKGKEEEYVGERTGQGVGWKGGCGGVFLIKNRGVWSLVSL